MIKQKNTRYSIISLIQLILVIGLCVLDYFTRKKMGAMRTIMFYNYYLEETYGIITIFAVIAILLLTIALYQSYKQKKLAYLSLLIPALMLIIIFADIKRIKLMKDVTLVVLSLIGILQIFKERNKMKSTNKMLALLLVGGITLAGCGNANDTATTDEAATTETVETTDTADTAETVDTVETEDDTVELEENADDAEIVDDADVEVTEEEAEVVDGEETTEEETTDLADVTVNEITGEELDKIEEDDKEKENYLVIDVRDAETYNEGHVKHAINIPAAELEDRLDEIADYKDTKVVAIADTKANSEEAAKILAANEFSDVYNADGIDEFTYTTITKVRTALPEEFKALAESGDYTIVDVRDAEDYNNGTMPGAINVPVDQAEELVPTLPTDKAFLTYCYSGNRSFIVANMLAEEGHEVINAWDGTKEYDGYDLSETK